MVDKLKDLNTSVDKATKRSLTKIHIERGTSRMLVLVVLSFALFAILKPNIFLNPLNLQNIMLASPEVGLLAIAIMLAMLTGGIDLSVVSIAVGTAVTIAGMYQALGDSAESMTVVIILCGFLMGLLGGVINGLLISRVGITPILATLGTMQIYNGLAIVFTGGKTLYGVPSALTTFGKTTVATVPALFWLFLIAAVLVAILLQRTPLGLKLFLQGSNAKAASYSGLNLARNLMATYVLSGALAALAGVVIVCRNPTASADYGQSYVLLVIVIAILGGTNPLGGFGTVAGVVLATLTLQIIQSGFNIMRLSSHEYAIAQGVILIIIMVIDQIGLKRRARKVPKQPKTPERATA